MSIWLVTAVVTQTSERLLNHGRPAFQGGGLFHVRANLGKGRVGPGTGWGNLACALSERASSPVKAVTH